MRRALAVVLAAFPAWLGFVVPSAASVDLAATPHAVHAYDAHGPNGLAPTVTDRVPPSLAHPDSNAGTQVTCARVCNLDDVIRRDALPLDGNPGGGPEPQIRPRSWWLPVLPQIAERRASSVWRVRGTPG